MGLCGGLGRPSMEGGDKSAKDYFSYKHTSAITGASVFENRIALVRCEATLDRPGVLMQGTCTHSFLGYTTRTETDTEMLIVHDRRG